MSHKKTYNLDPTKINNYNKFLKSMDKNNMNINEINIDPSNNYYDILVNDKHKELIKNVIQQINNNFDYNNYKSPNFCGTTQNDTILSNIETYDPNVYFEKEIKQKSIKSMRKKIHFDNSIGNSNININEDISDTKIIEINIETEINSISDILMLIEKYKIDPLIKYNINMKALHNIEEPLKELNNMIGMNELKKNIVDQILYFIQELHINKDFNHDFMHTVIYGSPGTGKTEIAKIMGKIYSRIGILKGGTFKKVTRSDLIAGYLGQTAIKTKDVIKDALGGVLFIDEAYSLGNPEKRDSFSKECIDTLCEALSDNKDNLMVIIAGYEKELKECFFSLNQGLDSRFVWRFKMDDYTHRDLYEIFLKKINDIGWSLEENSKITDEWFKKNKEYFPFYGRDIEIILAKTKIAHSRRVFCRPKEERKKINLKDLENGLEIYIKNSDNQNKKQDEYFKKQLHNSLYC